MRAIPFVAVASAALLTVANPAAAPLHAQDSTHGKALDVSRQPSFAGEWVGEEIISMPHGMADGKTATATVAVTCIISPDEKQIFWRWRRVFGVEFPSPGRTFQIEAREGRTIKWSSTDEVPPLLEHGPVKFRISMSLTMAEDGKTANLSGSGAALTGELKGMADFVTGTFHKSN
jgi:hypothetical protein